VSRSVQSRDDIAAAGAGPERGVDIDAEESCVRLYVIGARMNQHRDGLAASEVGVGKVQCDRAFAAPRSAGKQVHSTVSHASEPVVEQSDAAPNDAANESSLRLLKSADDEAGTMVEANASVASSPTNPSIHVPCHECR
jgi:hypothetical protein